MFFLKSIQSYDYKIVVTDIETIYRPHKKSTWLERKLYESHFPRSYLIITILNTSNVVLKSPSLL